MLRRNKKDEKAKAEKKRIVILITWNLRVLVF